jgi:hypothetical protein
LKGKIKTVKDLILWFSSVELLIIKKLTIFCLLFIKVSEPGSDKSELINWHSLFKVNSANYQFLSVVPRVTLAC